MAVQDDIFNYLSGSRLQSQVESPRQMMVFMPLVVVWIGQFCRGVIGRQNMKVTRLPFITRRYFNLSQ